VLGIFVIPGLYVVFQHFREWVHGLGKRKEKPAPPSAPAPAPAPAEGGH